MNKIPREITIRPCLNGFICKVGCQQVVFNDRTTLLNSLQNYLNDPDQVEKEWLGRSLHRGLCEDPLGGQVVRNVGRCEPKNSVETPAHDAAFGEQTGQPPN